MKPINCSCGAVLLKFVELPDSVRNVIVKCYKCGKLYKVVVLLVPQIKVEPVKVD